MPLCCNVIIIILHYRAFQYPLPQPNWAMEHIETYIFSRPYINSRYYHAHFQNYSLIDLLPVLRFICQGLAHFNEQFMPVSGMAFQKMTIKPSVIGLDFYIIPHFNANMTCICSSTTFISEACAVWISIEWVKCHKLKKWFSKKLSDTLVSFYGLDKISTTKTFYQWSLKYILYVLV